MSLATISLAQSVRQNLGTPRRPPALSGARDAFAGRMQLGLYVVMLLAFFLMASTFLFVLR